MGPRNFILVFFTVLLLTGCSALPNKTTHYYVITPIEQSAQLKTNRALSINIASVHVPPYLDKPSIVSRSKLNTLIIANNHRWGGKLRKSLARIMAQNLSTLLVTPNVAIAPNSVPVSPDVVIEISILQFERNKDKRVQLSAQWRIVKGKDFSPLLARMTHLIGEEIKDTENYDMTIASMSELYAQLSEEIAIHIIKELKL